MSKKDVDKFNVICLGHKPPAMDLNLVDHFVTHTDTGTDKTSIIPKEFIDNINGGTLSEFLHLFWLLDRPDFVGDRLYICQYRRFISIVPPNANRASNAPFTYVVDSETANRVFPSKNDLSKIEGLYSTIVRPLGGMWAQFAAHHPVEDLENFCTVLDANGILSKSEVRRFRKCPFLIPCSSLGMWKGDDFNFVVSLLKEAWIDFCMSGLSMKREGYNSRVGGFMLERLLSFLIIDGFASPLIQSGYKQGHQCTITTESFIRATVGS